MNVIKTEKMNTNNGWGFGGWIGKREIFDNGLIKEKGNYCFRHSKDQPYLNWYVEWDKENKVIISVRNNYTKKHKFILFFECVTKGHEQRKAVLFSETETNVFSEYIYTDLKLEYKLTKVEKI